MADGDDLPDADYESIYGADMLEARQRAQDLATLRRIEANLAEQRRLIDQDTP